MRNDSLPHPGRDRLPVEAHLLEGGTKALTRQVDGRPDHPSSSRLAVADAAQLVPLGSGVVDLVHRGQGQLGHPPRPRVEPRTQDDLPGGVVADRRVDGDGPRHHRDSRPADHLVRQPVACLGRDLAGADAVHDGAIGSVEQLSRYRVGEASHGEPAVGGRPALTDHDRRAAGRALRHPSSLPVRRRP